jgi:hypothetical protein
MMRAALVAMLAVMLASGAWAQGPGGGPAGAVAGQSYGIGPRAGAQHPTPLTMFGGVAIGIWTRVPPPYDVTANRSAAANPLP